MKVYQNYSLRENNTFGIDVRCKYFADYGCEGDLVGLLSEFSEERILPIGMGSNMLLCGDFDGCVLRSSFRDIEVKEVAGSYYFVEVGAGCIMDELIAYLISEGIGGMENLSLIPGTVGGAVVQNAGAYGVEIGDFVETVQTVDIQTRSLHLFTSRECQFSYRDSVFKRLLRGRHIITRVVLRLRRVPEYCLDYGSLRQIIQGEPDSEKIRQAIIGIRNSKLPKVGEVGSAGSFFKNPIISGSDYIVLKGKYGEMPYHVIDEGGEKRYKLSAAWVIDRCGLRGVCVGGAMVYEKQPLVIVNVGNATYRDILRLADKIIVAVRNEMGIVLEPEVEYVR